VFVQRGDEDRKNVRELLSQGLMDREVAAISGVSQTTVGRWRRSWPPIAIRWRPAHESSYAYLLGLYLGDGCVSELRGGATLRITLDLRYPGIIEECWAAMVLAMPKHRPAIVARTGCQAAEVQACGKLWLHASPQHGTGRKHERPITLEPWQVSNLSDDIRGLFCATCDALGVRWTLSNPRNVSVSHRRSVAALDGLGCAKG